MALNLSDQNRLLNYLRATEDAVELHTFIALIHGTLAISTTDDIIQIFRCLTIIFHHFAEADNYTIVYLPVRMYLRWTAE